MRFDILNGIDDTRDFSKRQWLRGRKISIAIVIAEDDFPMEGAEELSGTKECLALGPAQSIA